MSDETSPMVPARVYKLKNAEEKEDPSYVIFRKRNNESVRRCRIRKKENEVKRDAEVGLIISKMSEKDTYCSLII
jgi:basic region leucine zipper protein